MGRRTRAAASIVVVVLAGACSSTSNGSAPSTSTVAASPTTVQGPGDGVLRLGLLLPETGPGANLGESLRAGAELAVREINAAGGVLGRPIQTVHRNEGDSSASATTAMDDLLGRDVDFIIGPASSRTAYSVLSHAVDAGVGVCSPTNTAIGLGDYPDGNLYFRTIPPDSLQARALGSLVERTGGTSVSVLAPDDDFGEDFAQAAADDMRSRNLRVLGPHRYDASSGDRSAAATAALAGEPESLVLIGSGAGGAAMLASVRAIAPDLPIFVNDSMKTSTVTAALGERAGVLLARVTGVAPHAEPDSPAFDTQFTQGAPDVSNDFSAYAYDCVNLVATAAAAAESDVPQEVIAQLEGVSRSGSPCLVYADCAAFLEDGQNINLRGASGELDLGTDGSVVSGLFRIFRFDAAGTPLDGALVPIG